MTDSKVPDAQCGMERAYNHALVGNAGANLIYESAGMMASLMGFSLESLLIDNDLIGAVQRTIRGIEVNDESISLETMRQVCLEGPGHYLGADQTLKLMQRDYIYPILGDRSSPNQWEERGRPSLVDRASTKLETILASHYPTHIPKDIDDAIRAQFPVRLPREVMRGSAT
jgi:trimethylamine--corrinoid protein Co-methyltransferase